MTLYSLPNFAMTALESLLAGSSQKQLRQASEALSDSYRSKQPGRHLQQSQSTQAYLAARLPATYAVNAAVLNELKRVAPDFKPQSVLELGAGPGTATLAAHGVYPDVKQLTLVEREQAMVQAGKTLFSQGPPALQSARWLALNLPDLPTLSAPPDLVLMSYVINEMGPARRSDLYAGIERLKPAVIVAIEPGTPEGSQHLIAMRAEFLKRGWQVWAPCPHGNTCPLADNDWCHFSQRLTRSSLQRYLKQGSQNFEDEKFAYLILSRQPAPKPAENRILRHPLLKKGHLELTLCSPEGARKLTVSRSETAYRLARKASWGDNWTGS